MKIFLNLFPFLIITEFFLGYTSMCDTGTSNPRMLQRDSFGFSCLQPCLCDFSHFLCQKGVIRLFPSCQHVSNQGSDRQALADPTVMSQGITTSRRSMLLLAGQVPPPRAEAVDGKSPRAFKPSWPQARVHSSGCCRSVFKHRSNICKACNAFKADKMTQQCKAPLEWSHVYGVSKTPHSNANCTKFRSKM